MNPQQTLNFLTFGFVTNPRNFLDFCTQLLGGWGPDPFHGFGRLFDVEWSLGQSPTVEVKQLGIFREIFGFPRGIQVESRKCKETPSQTF